jgi:hypothetical protein
LLAPADPTRRSGAQLGTSIANTGSAHEALVTAGLAGWNIRKVDMSEERRRAQRSSTPWSQRPAPAAPATPARSTTVARAAAQELPELLKAGPVIIRVPDFGDPCGTRKVAHVLEAAYVHDTWDSEYQRMTVGRWMLVFGGEYLYPTMLVTPADWPYEVTTDAPEESGPCDGCRAFQAGRRPRRHERARTRTR